MNVLISGNQNPYELTDGYVRGFRSAGANVDVFAYYDYLKAKADWAKDIRPLKFASIVVARRMALLEMLRQANAKRYDLILLLKCDDLPTVTLPLLRKVCPGAKIAIFHPDDPFNVRLLYGPSHRRALTHARLADHYFIWSHKLIARLRSKGCKNISYLGFAVDPALADLPEPPFDVRQEFKADVSFVGNWDEKREIWLRPLAESGIDLALWGGDYWKVRCKSPELSRCWRGRPVFGTEFAAAVRGGRIALNILRTFNAEAENMRTYEIPAFGGVMLAERSVQQAALFREGVDAFYTSDPIDLVRQAQLLLQLPETTLTKLRASAILRSRSYTYEERAREILATLF